MTYEFGFYHHQQELSLAFYDTNRVGAILNTLTGDVQTIQSFASTLTLTIVTDVLSLVGMIVVMFLLRWDFARIAIAVTPLLAPFAPRVNKAVRGRGRRGPQPAVRPTGHHAGRSSVDRGDQGVLPRGPQRAAVATVRRAAPANRHRPRASPRLLTPTPPEVWALFAEPRSLRRD